MVIVCNGQLIVCHCQHLSSRLKDPERCPSFLQVEDRTLLTSITGALHGQLLHNLNGFDSRSLANMLCDLASGLKVDANRLMLAI